MINALIVLHVVLYYAFDRKAVGCVDFFGLATFLGKGQITAGTVFLGALIVLTLVLGRVFCGWGCHFALFQDLLTRLFDRLGVRVPFRRSRLELVIPPILFFVTLAYPILAWWRHNGVPRSATVDLAYPDVWHLLPGLKGVLLILVFDVVVLTLLFGSRAFCRFLCPYGLFLKPFHALSPVRVVKAGDCSGCGQCARACPTGVPIKHEVETFGVIRDLNCMNCGDCIPACPDGALKLRITKRAYFGGFARVVTGSSLPLWAELTIVTTVVLGLFLYRGREFGDFLSAALGMTVGAAIVVVVRPQQFLRPRWISRWQSLRLTAGIVSGYLVLGLVGQAIARYSLSTGESALRRGEYASVVRAYSIGRGHEDRFGWTTFYLDGFSDRAKRELPQLLMRADASMKAEGWSDAAALYRAALLVDREIPRVHGDLGTALMKQGSFWEASQCYLKVLEYDPEDLVALYHLAMTYIQLDQRGAAADLVHRILAIDTVGNAYQLINENPLFLLLEDQPTYRAAMALRANPSSNPSVFRGRKP